MLPPEVIFNCKFLVTDLPNEYVGILGLDALEKLNIHLFISRRPIKEFKSTVKKSVLVDE